MNIGEVDKKVKKLGLKNVEMLLFEGYNFPLADRTANVICAIDMFFIIKNPIRSLES